MAIYLMVDDTIKKVRRRPFSICSQLIDELDRLWSTAAAKCDLDCLKKLYENEHDLINKKDCFTGYAAVHWACKKGQADLLKWLFDHKADMTIRTNGGYAPLHIATMHGKEHLIYTLIEVYGCDINTRDYSGRKASHYLKLDSSKPIQNALEAMPSILGLHIDCTFNRAQYPNVWLSSSISMPAISKEDSYKNRKNSAQERKKKRSMSLTQSFKHRKKVAVEKRTSFDNSDSPPYIDNRRRRTPSAPDINSNSLDNRKKPLIEHPDFENNQRKISSASENIINGYAGYINNNKHHRKLTNNNTIGTDKEKQWAINTWV